MEHWYFNFMVASPRSFTKRGDAFFCNSATTWWSFLCVISLTIVEVCNYAIINSFVVGQ
jgi:hypothetical protein